MVQDFQVVHQLTKLRMWTLRKPWDKRSLTRWHVCQSWTSNYKIKLWLWPRNDCVHLWGDNQVFVSKSGKDNSNQSGDAASGLWVWIDQQASFTLRFFRSPKAGRKSQSVSKHNHMITVQTSWYVVVTAYPLRHWRCFSLASLGVANICYREKERTQNQMCHFLWGWHTAVRY